MIDSRRCFTFRDRGGCRTDECLHQCGQSHRLLHGGGVARFAFEVDLAIMEAVEARAVGHMQHHGIADFRAQQFHHARLAEFIERRRRLVHDDDVRPLQQHAGEGEALLLWLTLAVLEGDAPAGSEAVGEAETVELLEGEGCRDPLAEALPVLLTVPAATVLLLVTLTVGGLLPVAVTLGQRDTLGLLLAEAVPELPPVRLELELGEAVEQALAVAVAVAHRVPVGEGLPAPPPPPTPPPPTPAVGLALVLAEQQVRGQELAQALGLERVQVRALALVEIGRAHV